jgi:hypothetical protein
MRPLQQGAKSGDANFLPSRGIYKKENERILTCPLQNFRSKVDKITIARLGMDALS